MNESCLLVRSVIRGYKNLFQLQYKNIYISTASTLEIVSMKKTKKNLGQLIISIPFELMSKSDKE